MPHDENKSETLQLKAAHFRDAVMPDRKVANDKAQLIALFRLLLQDPPPEHDCATCTICKRYKITGI